MCLGEQILCRTMLTRRAVAAGGGESAIVTRRFVLVTSPDELRFSESVRTNFRLTPNLPYRDTTPRITCVTAPARVLIGRCYSPPTHSSALNMHVREYSFDIVAETTSSEGGAVTDLYCINLDSWVQSLHHT